jgi:Glycosyltransferase family 87
VRSLLRQRWISATVSIAVLLAAGASFVVAVHDKLPPKFAGDFLCFWTAGNLLAGGQSPYDADLQTQFQAEYGWSKEREGIGVYDYLPYFYPPWFGFLFVPLVPLGYGTAKAIWLAANIELTLITGYVLRNFVPGVSPLVPIILVPVFALSLSALVFGQPAMLILFLLAVTWRLLEARADGCAGVALAWLTIKPQLAVLLLPAVLVYVVRQGRWRVVLGFAAMLAVLCVGSTLLLPYWPMQMLTAIRGTPLPSDFKPWFGSTWLCMLKWAGLHGWLLWIAYAALVLPLLAALARAAIDQDRPIGDVLGLSLLAVFFVASYARAYDYPVLLIPFLVVLGRLPQLLASLALLVLLIGPYAHILSFPFDAPEQGYIFWIPLLLAALWGASGLSSGFVKALRRAPELSNTAVKET